MFRGRLPQPVAHATHAVLRTKLHGPPAIPGLAGTDLARKYIFAVHPFSEDYSSLSLPVVREGLPLLSKAIISVKFYLPSHSLVLSLLRADLTREAFDSALHWSVEAVKAMGG